jgi:hypothetical protein
MLSLLSLLSFLTHQGGATVSAEDETDDVTECLKQ